MIRSSSENVQMVSAQYLVKELMDLDHILIHSNFPLKQWTQGQSDTDYQLPILFLKYHIPDRDIPNFLLCLFSYKLTHQSLFILQNRFFFDSNKNLCDLIPAGATPLSADFLLLKKCEKRFTLLTFFHQKISMCLVIKLKFLT